MTPGRPTLTAVSTSLLQRLRGEIETGVLRTPIDRAGLAALGVRDQVDELLRALSGHARIATLTILDIALAERERRNKRPELVWTGPEASSATARDTAIVLRELLEQANESVVLAGYDFTYGRDILEPLFISMRDKGIKATFIVHVHQVTIGIDPGVHLQIELGKFVRYNWPFGAPYPDIYYDKRALVPGPPYSTMHAKCVVVDGLRAYVSSANFTQRAQERNIEVGVLLDDPSFARFLASQWLGLIEAGLVARFAAAP